MMNNIDFLPDIYRQRNQQLRSTQWWCVAGCAAASLLALFGAYQGAERWKLQGQISQFDQLANQTQQQEAELAQLSREMAVVDDLAQLIEYLKHPWPRTQLLAAAIRPLSDTIHLTELVIREEAMSAAGSPQVSPPAESSSSGAESPTIKDLHVLKTECDRNRTQIVVGGWVANLADLHTYVANVGQSPLVASATLKKLETVAEPNVDPTTVFQLLVIARAGYGQVGGPEHGPPSTTETKQPAGDRVAQRGSPP